MHHTVVQDLVFPNFVLRRGGEGAIDEEVCSLEMSGLGSELLDGVSSALIWAIRESL